MNRLMCHLVAGYPGRDRTLPAAEAMAEGGAKYLEIQFPFSDPAADGPIIQDACTRALEEGFTVDEGFRLIGDIVRRLPGIPVFLMTYGSLAVRPGIEVFLRRACDAGAAGVIIPDLPFDYDEGLYEAGAKTGISVVPVVVPGTAPARIEAIRRLAPRDVYAALRTGITGSKTELGPENLAFLDGLKGWGARIFAGFGISTKAQVDALMPHAEAAVAGSHFVRIIRENEAVPAKEFRRSLVDAVRELTGP